MLSTLTVEFVVSTVIQNGQGGEHGEGRREEATVV
jgi:hypothetical protein